VGDVRRSIISSGTRFEKSIVQKDYIPVGTLGLPKIEVGYNWPPSPTKKETPHFACTVM
jgi:hypothetical protein